MTVHMKLSQPFQISMAGVHHMSSSGTGHRKNYATLRAENVRLRAEIERLRAQLPNRPPVVASGNSPGLLDLFELLGQRRDTLQPSELETRLQRLEAANTELKRTNEQLSRELSGVMNELTKSEIQHSETMKRLTKSEIQHSETKHELSGVKNELT